MCIPGNAHLSLDIPVGAKSDSEEKQIFDKWVKWLPDEYKPNNEHFKSDQKYNVDKNSNAIYTVTLDWISEANEIKLYPSPEDSLYIEKFEYHTNDNKTNITLIASVINGQELKHDSLETLIVFKDSSGNQMGINFHIKLTHLNENKKI